MGMYLHGEDSEAHGEMEKDTEMDRGTIADEDSLMRYFLIGNAIGFSLATLLASCWRGLF